MAEYRYDIACEDCLHNGVCCTQEHCSDIKQYIQDFGCCDFKAVADVVEVVRCKYCVHSAYPETRIVWCNRCRAYVPLGGYCNYGDRKPTENE